MAKIKDKGKISKAEKENQQDTSKGTHRNMSVDLIAEMLQSYMVNLQCSGVSEFDGYVLVLSLEGEKMVRFVV